MGGYSGGLPVLDLKSGLVVGPGSHRCPGFIPPLSRGCPRTRCHNARPCVVSETRWSGSVSGGSTCRGDVGRGSARRYEATSHLLLLTVHTAVGCCPRMTGGSSISGILAACLAVALLAVTAGSGLAKSRFIATKAQCKEACDRTPVATCSGLQHRKLKRCRRRLLHDCRKQGTTAVCPSPEFIACSTPRCATSRLEACAGLDRHFALPCQRHFLRLCLVRGPDVYWVLSTTSDD